MVSVQLSKVPGTGGGEEVEDIELHRACEPSQRSMRVQGRRCDGSLVPARAEKPSVRVNASVRKGFS